MTDYISPYPDLNDAPPPPSYSTYVDYGSSYTDYDSGSQPQDYSY